jgi:hypothetical protein
MSEGVPILTWMKTMGLSYKTETVTVRDSLLLPRTSYRVFISNLYILIPNVSSGAIVLMALGIGNTIDEALLGLAKSISGKIITIYAGARDSEQYRVPVLSTELVGDAV